MRETQLAKDFNLVPAADTNRGCGPLPDAVHGDDGGLLEGRRIKRGRGVRLVMLAEENLAGVRVEMITKVVRHQEFFAKPQWHGHQERPQTLWGARDVGFQQAIKLDEWLFVKADEIELVHGDAGFTQAILNRSRWKPRIVLLSGEPFF